VQGFLLSRPVPADSVTALLRTTPSVTAALLRPQAVLPRPRRVAR
jgi:hypothetical protein